MLEVNISEKYNVYTTEMLTQWDTNQILKITGISGAITVLFFNRLETTNDPINTFYSDGGYNANIPNGLLTEPYPIIAFVRQKTDTAYTTIAKIKIPVVPCAKPEDYEYIENISLYTYEDLLAELSSKANTIDLEVERKRIDQILSLGTDTENPNNAELTDIRVGADGKTYTLAGESVRQQIGKIVQFNEDGDPKLNDDIIGEKMIYTKNFSEEVIKPLKNGPYKMQSKKIWDGATETEEYSPYFKVSDYIDMQIEGYSIFYQEDRNTIVREGWGTYSDILNQYPDTVYIRVKGDTSSVMICEKIYNYNQIDYAGKYDVLSGDEEVTDLVYKQAVATNYTEDDIDFSKPAKLNLRGNGQFRVYNIWNTVILNLDNCNNTEFEFPDSSYKVMVNGFNDGATFTYYKKTERHTVPSLKLLPDNVTTEFTKYLEQILHISSDDNSGALDDLAEGRELVWNEEFNKNSVDRSVWQYEIGTDRRGYLRNLEEHPEINAFVDSSNLNLKILRDHPTPAFSWSGSILRSVCGFEFLYGLIEAKIKFPPVGGYMSFWLMGENGIENFSDTNSDKETINNGYGWPKCGEIDIAESDGGKVSCTIHYQNAEGEHESVHGNSNYSATSTEDYHIYGLEWTETKMSVYLDRNLVKEFDITQCAVDGFNPFNNPMHIVLSILNGGAGVIGTNPPDDVNERTGQIDWVRVYTPKGVENKNPEKIVIDDNQGEIIEKSVGDEWFPNLEVTPVEVVNRTALWTSSNDTVVTVCPNGGYIKCIGAGYATVTCTMYNGIQTSIIIHVTA